jgi:hypothetical protein
MFKELMPVITDRPLTITVAALADGKIRVCIVPQAQDKDERSMTRWDIKKKWRKSRTHPLRP